VGIIFQLVVEEQTPQALESGHVEEEVGVLLCFECPIFGMVLGVFLY